MSSRRQRLRPGQSTVFTTRVLDQRTRLYALAAGYDPGAFFPRVSWHIELCCQPTHIGQGPQPIDIYAAGALVTVRNIDSIDAEVFTDYL